MIESTQQALDYADAVVAGLGAPTNPEAREAFLLLSRALRQATQTLADHAQAPGVREGDGAGVSDEFEGDLRGEERDRLERAATAATLPLHEMVKVRQADLRVVLSALEAAEAEMERRERDTACAYPGAVPGHWKAEAERQTARAEAAEARVKELEEALKWRPVLAEHAMAVQLKNKAEAENEALRAERDRLRAFVHAVRDGIARGALGGHLAEGVCPCSLHELLRALASGEESR